MLLTDIVPNLPSDLKNLFKDNLEKFVYTTGNCINTVSNCINTVSSCPALS